MDPGRDGDTQVVRCCMGRGVSQEVLAQLEAVQRGGRALEGDVLADAEAIGAPGAGLHSRRVMDGELTRKSLESISLELIQS